MSIDRSLRALIVTILASIALSLPLYDLTGSLWPIGGWLPALLALAAVYLVAGPRPGAVAVPAYPTGRLPAPERAGILMFAALPPSDEGESVSADDVPEAPSPVGALGEPTASAQATHLAAGGVRKSEAEREVDDFRTAGVFAPPTSMDGVLNPPTERSQTPGAVLQYQTPIQENDPARHETPLRHITEPIKPAKSQAERLKQNGGLLQPAATAQNEFQDGEYVAANQPTRSAPPPTVLTGERMAEGEAPLEPQKQAVLEAMAAPVPIYVHTVVDASRPEVADAVLSDRETPETADGLTHSETIQPWSAAPDTVDGRSDLMAIPGIDPPLQAALQAAGISTYTQLAAAGDEQLRAAVDSVGARHTPEFSIWREQAGFLARGDRAGFEALANAMRAG